MGAFDPELVGSLTGTLEDNFYKLLSVVVKGNFAYIAGRYGEDNDDAIYIVNIVNKEDPTIHAYITGGTADFGSGVRIVDVVGNYIYAIGYSSDEFMIIDISTKSNPTKIGTYKSSVVNGARDGTIQGNYAYIGANNANQLVVIDISDKTNPSYVTKITGLNGIRPVAGRGNYVYCGTVTGTDYFNIINVIDPENLIVEAQLEDSDFKSMCRIAFETALYLQSSIPVEPRYAFATDSYSVSETIFIIDITIKGHPIVIKKMKLDGSTGKNIHDLVIQDDFLYITYGHEIVVYDVSNKMHPVRKGSVEVTYPYYLVIDGDYLYVTSYNAHTLSIFQLPVIYDGFHMVSWSESNKVKGETMQDLHRGLTYRLNIPSDINQRTEQVQFWSDEEILRSINEGYLDFVRRTMCLQKFTTIALVAEQVEYDLPSDCIKLLWVSDGTRNLVGQSLAYMDDLDPGWLTRDGEPAYYVQELAGIKKFNLYETPETSGIATFTADTNHTEADADHGLLVGLEQDDTEVTFTADINHTEANADHGIVINLTGEPVLLSEERETGTLVKLDQQTDNLMILYAYEPVLFNNLQEAQTPDFLAAYHLALVNFAVSELYLKEGEIQNIPLSDFYKMLYEDAVQNALKTQHVSNLKLVKGGSPAYNKLPPGPHLPYDTYPAN